MSRKYLIIFIALLCACNNKQDTLQARQDKLFKKDGKAVLAEIAQMEQADQDIRNLFNYGTSDKQAIDSIIRFWSAKGIDIDSMEMMNDTFLVSRPVLDSLAGRMRLQDTKHTQRMIAILNKYGFPDPERLGDNNTHVSPLLILHHADMSYKDQLLPVLQKELEIARIDTNAFEDLKWHLNGRVGIPDLTGVTIIQMDRTTGKADTIRK